ncbi:NAD-dependent epimerase/dehydratase family protein [Arthrobacter burdickii]|uniref:NAD-dependent epimerase/dehydratase family protein n=1 Tax=Arthrobacter burdickii TaxID=3035920 RepID=A0ABT8K2D4_9MICC|nr:NAD-dependent epimerase/dehydratase family protein [Arthrobacter burdickii]MDN4611571.1 NAD-dependent epimerase/dehydratase family protein [Arthrobacter burdickii]
MSRDQVHVVVGASGGTGAALVRELLRREYRVRGVNRSGRADVPAGVEIVRGDAADPERMRQVCQDAGVVYNAVNPPLDRWREDFPAVVDGVLAGAEAAGARMVFVDDTWMYGRVSGPMTEDLPERPVCNKGVLRAWLAERVLAAHARGQVATVIGRAPELYGPGVESLLGRTLFGAAVRGRSGLWAGSTTEPLTPMFIEDFAYGLVELGENTEALGQVWHLPTPPPTTAGEFIDGISIESGRRFRVHRVSPGLVRAAGIFSTVAREGAEMLYQFEHPHVIDSTKYRNVFGHGKVTSYEAGIRATLDWYRTRQPARGLIPSGR